MDDIMRNKIKKLFEKYNEERLDLITKRFTSGLSYEGECRLVELNERCNNLCPRTTPEMWANLYEMEEYLIKSEKAIKKCSD